ncbi:MAG: HAD family phosphatase [Planctomycetales bacterium]
MIRTILFDMGNVLVHFSHERMCRQIAEVCGVPTEIVRESLLKKGVQWDFERGRQTEEEFFRQCCDEFGVTKDPTLEEFRHAASDIFTLNASIVPVLDALKSRGHRLVLISNTSISHFEFVRREFDVLSRFEDFVLSYEVGVLKPDREIFEAAARAIECAPAECLYTDDIAPYVAAGREFGFDAELFTTTEAFTAALQRRGLSLTSI